LSGPASRTLLATFFPTSPDGSPPAKRWLALEATVVTGISAALSVALGFREAGFVALFLVATSLTDRLTLLLDDNRAAIWDRRDAPIPANVRTAASLWFMWFGVLAGYGVVALCLNPSSLDGFFGFALDAAGVGEGSLGAGLGSFAGLLMHNLSVLAAVVVLSLLFRGYGTMLALSWNACVWAFVLAQHLTTEGWGTLPKLLLAVGPHLAMEGLAYVVGGLAAVYLSLGLVRYPLGDARLRSVLGAVVRLFCLAVALLVVSAFAEARWAPVLLSR